MFQLENKDKLLVVPSVSLRTNNYTSDICEALNSIRLQEIFVISIL